MTETLDIIEVYIYIYICIYISLCILTHNSLEGLVLHGRSGSTEHGHWHMHCSVYRVQAH